MPPVNSSSYSTSLLIIEHNVINTHFLSTTTVVAQRAQAVAVRSCDRTLERRNNCARSMRCREWRDNQGMVMQHVVMSQSGLLGLGLVMNGEAAS